MPKLVFVRHSVPVVTPDQAPGNWRLSDDGRRRATRLGEDLRATGLASPNSGVAASAETKAIETGRLLGMGAVDIDHRLGEVAKPWYCSPDEHRHAAMRYLSGNDLPGWESRADTVNRFDAALSAIVDDVRTVVTHGTVWTLWLSEHLRPFDAADFWLSLRMPDAYEFDTASSVLQRVGR